MTLNAILQLHLAFGLFLATVIAFSPALESQAQSPKQSSAFETLSASATAPSAQYDVTGQASWYGPGLDGHLDARGEIFDQDAMTAAHRTLPLNSLVRVTNVANGRTVIVRITDRGPYARRRLIDLSRAAADALGYISDGVARVNVRAIEETTSPDGQQRDIG